MARLIILIGIVVLGCGEFVRQWDCGVEGEKCEKIDRGSRNEDGDGGTVGPQGEPGSPGPKGDSGEDGSSCSVEQLSNGIRYFCSDGTEGVVYNGEDGTDGEDGADGADGAPGVTSETHDPCGDKLGKTDEILFLLDTGEVLRIYNNKYLTVLVPGNYRTQDGTYCYFTITSEGEIINEHY